MNFEHIVGAHLSQGWKTDYVGGGLYHATKTLKNKNGDLKSVTLVWNGAAVIDEQDSHTELAYLADENDYEAVVLTDSLKDFSQAEIEEIVDNMKIFAKFFDRYIG
ncbi:hypothetical protein [Halobacillus litoralis]|uniref:hypothetical protein n=1 Tax=Halobacillus litoralis TaxID=45668 RepID=UPI001CD29AAF|nr:hypothetical protein [Halobacillus litoralis]MCA1021600.1 hypothetical protein [Halobacillus litoralis]